MNSDRRDEPEILYHYTSIDTMLQIVASREMWATSIEYLNDVSEQEFFLRKVRERLPNYVQEKVPVGDINICSHVYYPDLRPDHGFEGKPFVTSFSKAPDSLPQWRAYCPRGNGVSIGFRVDCLKNATPVASLTLSEADATEKPPNVTFASVQYLQADDNSIVDSVLDAAFMVARGQVTSGPSLDIPVAQRPEVFEKVINTLASRMKHESFSNEDEYRLIVEAPYSARRFIHFRAIRSTLCPYIRLAFTDDRNSYHEVGVNRSFAPLQRRSQWIDRVVIGPTPNMKLTQQAMESLFKKNRMHVEVASSTSPFRSWLS